LRGEYMPYSTEELIDLIADVKPSIPQYCRVNRIVRDIPSDNVVAGSKRTSLRQDIQRTLKQRGDRCECVRCREVRGKAVAIDELSMNDMVYSAGGAEEHFLSFVTPDDRLAGYLRLSLPGASSPETGLADLSGAALVRELHIYGQSLEVGEEEEGAAQHYGLGAQLMSHAESLSRERGYGRMAVISALGTRGYYSRIGYKLAGTYMVKSLV
jgi:elongator complex protein 3